MLVTDYTLPSLSCPTVLQDIDQVCMSLSALEALSSKIFNISGYPLLCATAADSAAVCWCCSCRSPTTSPAMVNPSPAMASVVNGTRNDIYLQEMTEVPLSCTLRTHSIKGRQPEAVLTAASGCTLGSHCLDLLLHM